MPSAAVSLVKRPPVSCMPSPESPANRITTSWTCSTCFAISSVLRLAHVHGAFAASHRASTHAPARIQTTYTSHGVPSTSVCTASASTAANAAAAPAARARTSAQSRTRLHAMNASAPSRPRLHPELRVRRLAGLERNIPAKRRRARVAEAEALRMLDHRLGAVPQRAQVAANRRLVERDRLAGRDTQLLRLLALVPQVGLRPRGLGCDRRIDLRPHDRDRERAQRLQRPATTFAARMRSRATLPRARAARRA